MSDGRTLPHWHGRRTLADLADTGDYAHCARPLELARTWVARHGTDNPPSKGLLLYGPNGTGKTSILAGLACTLGVPDGCRYWDMRNLSAVAKSEMAVKTRETAVDRAVRPSVLVADDIGKQRGTDWVVETVRDLIERRFDRPGYTHVATNLEPRDLASLLGPAAWSRLQAMCAFVPVVGPDMRMSA